MSAASADAHISEGNAHLQAGRFAPAADCYRRALLLAPDHRSALYNLGASQRELNQRAEAEASFRRLLAVDPTDVDGRFQLGELLLGEARFSEAAAILGPAFVLSPRNPLLGFYLGMALARSGGAAQSVGILRQVLELEPDMADAQLNLGNAYGLLQQHALATAAYRAASRARPENPLYRGALLNQMQQTCEWEGIGELVEQQRRAAVTKSSETQPGEAIHPFHLISIPSTRAEQLACSRIFAATQEVPVAGRLPATPARTGGDGRIRIGYLSADFHAHATAYLTAELFELHDRSRFHIAAYSSGPQTTDPMQKRLRAAFDRFVDVKHLSAAAAAAAIRAGGVDILVDLKGFTLEARTDIVALRPAPVQVNYLGYPGTMGAPYIDYLVADRFVIPASHEADYDEKLVLMPASYQVTDRQRPVGETPPRSALGLPARVFVFCAFHQPYKIMPDVFAVWMRLLQAVPDSVLWLLDGNPSAVANLRREAKQAGVNVDRLIFAPKLEQAPHIARLAAADLFLDTLPCNAHTTASDALWAGLPVLTCAGETFAARVAGSVLHAVGLPELVTHSLPEYERRAIALATSPDELRGLREKLQAQRLTAPLFDTPRYVRQLESAYEKMWRNHQAGHPPSAITPDT